MCTFTLLPHDDISVNARAWRAYAPLLHPNWPCEPSWHVCCTAVAVDLVLQLLLQKWAFGQARLGVPWPLIQPLDGVLPLIMVHTIHINMPATCNFMAKRWERALASRLPPGEQSCHGPHLPLVPTATWVQNGGPGQDLLAGVPHGSPRAM